MSRWTSLVVGVLSFALASEAATQEVTDSLQWTRVRVTAWDSTYDRTVTVGILSRVTADSLILARGKRTMAVARDRVLLVEASDGGNGLTGAVAGFLVGAAVGTLAWRTYFDAHSLDDSENLYFGWLFSLRLRAPRPRRDLTFPSG